MVPEDSLTNPEFAVIRYDDDDKGVGLVLVDVDGKNVWLLMHQVAPADFE